MPEFGLGATFIVLIPGVLVYCALYGIFSGNNSGGQEPPDAHSIQSLTVILLGAVAVHLVTAVLIACAYAVGHVTHQVIAVPGDVGDYYAMLSSALAKDARSPSPNVLAYLLVAATIQSTTAYALVRLALNKLAQRNALPLWLYGWTARFTNQYSDRSNIVIAYVLTDTDVASKTILYVGAVRDMSVSSGGCVQRVSLIKAERHCIDLTMPLLLGAPLAIFDFMVIESERIRNVSFAIVPTAGPTTAVDLLATAFARLYGAG